ncbi:hypothetical protein E6P09_14805 [Haloferax mediterranei ATCC 33500]|uniref:Uncharacterized protein n=1 Tax=Haloferax mediterranei (strain ATCC 33500 / DSM 1411 / JCM 8866 / NBRC 14739 / NCIMB 2177 / R-4) TaxID=523841 RepID=M0IVX8_HALMT|nr:hypothetical protein [Haloferax mediterranei]AHZ23458.1 hypothetical protein BM92_12770 [Haloferax mediterranei ATCC 33500]ELZ99629.1 hypothetical protein C439_13784 [Haloferax mediterranei ATCC 33500]MDX5987168.1 hypothetical protein [Haloferax mediterranei ATCC 33500]QCQ76474.1 hypothetical protein E6P09_14805 [Haloferax mediterranei ATCC 33500]
MNRHFSDARYYFRRGFEHLYDGLTEETEPLRRRLMEMLGREEAEEAGPQTPRERVERGAREAATQGRQAVRKVRRRVR